MKLFLLALSSILFIFSSSVIANDLNNVKDIVAAANHAAFYQGHDGKARARMLIVDSQGRKQFRQFTIARKDQDEQNGDQNFFVYFERPSDVKKTAFLVNKHIGKEDDRWLYLPSLDLVKRIAAGDKRTSFVGSHFYYEDVSGREINEDHHRLVETNEQHYVVEGIPKDKAAVEFSRYRVWIDKTNMLPVKTVYFDNQDKEYRKIQAIEVKTVNGFPTATKIRIDDLIANGYTLMELRNIQYNIGLKSEHFSERSLRNPPGNLIE